MKKQYEITKNKGLKILQKALNEKKVTACMAEFKRDKNVTSQIFFGEKFNLCLLIARLLRENPPMIEGVLLML